MEDGHRIVMGGKCLWCGATREQIEDYRAPPWCPERPEDTYERPAPSDNCTGY